MAWGEGEEPPREQKSAQSPKAASVFTLGLAAPGPFALLRSGYLKKEDCVFGL